MQIIQSKSSLVEKVLRDREGRLVRAVFCVYENDGRIKARLVDFVYITEKVLKNTVFALSGFTKTKSSPIPSVGERVIVSPYFVSDILYLSGSKPRAPTFG